MEEIARRSKAIYGKVEQFGGRKIEKRQKYKSQENRRNGKKKIRVAESANERISRFENRRRCAER